MFVVIAAALIIVVVLLIAWPLFRNSVKQRPTGIDSSGADGSVDLESERQNILASLTDLEADLQGGKITQSDYERLKDIDEHRLAGILDKIDSAGSAAKISAGIQARGDSPEPATRFRTMNIAGFILLTILVIGGASGVYYYQNVKIQNQNLEAMMEDQAGTAVDGAPNPLD